MWELRIQRLTVQRASNGRRRTVGRYGIYHDGEQVKGALFSGAVAECAGPGDNTARGNEFDRRVEAGTYPLATQAGTKYVTLNYKDSVSPKVYPKPGVELMHTGARSEILIHPGIGFLASVGCINLCTRLPDANERIDYVGSRRRIIAMIDDMRAFLTHDFPSYNGKAITGAVVVISGEPE